MLIARYTANASGVVPTFNEGYQYTVNETNSNGIYTVELSSDTDFTRCSFNGKSQLLTVEYLKVTNNVTDMSYMFYKCRKLQTLDASNWDTSNVTTMENTFYGCKLLTTLDVSNWDTFKVEDMQWMFGFYENGNEIMSLTSINGLEDWDTTNVTNVEGMFCHCRNLTTLDVSNFDTSNVTNMAYMFRGCHSLTTLDVSNWDTSNVTTMENTFYGCKLLTTLDVSNWDIGKAINMAGMFYDCNNLTSLNLSGWDISNVTIMESMFNIDEKLKYVTMNNSNYNSVNKIIEQLPTRTNNSMGILYVVGVDDISQVDATTAQSKYWNVADKIPIARYTANASGVVPTFNNGYQYTVNETNSNGIYTVELSSDTDFTRCSFSGNANLLTVDYLKVTNNVTDMSYMFINCSSLTSLNVSNWDTSEVTDMSGMFYRCSQLTQLDLSNWDISEVTDMGSMFSNCSSLNNIIATNVSTSTLSTLITELPTRTSNSYGILNVTVIGDVAQDDITTAQSKYWNIVVKFLVAKYKFNNTLYDLIPTFNTELTDYTHEDIVDGEVTTRTIYSDSLPTLMRFGARGNSNKKSQSLLEVNYLNTSNVTDMSYMFDKCNNVGTINAENFNTSNATKMNYMFCSCRNLTSLDLSNFDTSKVTNMGNMFTDCQSLASLNVSNWDTNKVNNMSYMFNGCQSLTSLDVSDFVTSDVTNMRNMFEECESLTTVGDLSNWDTSNVEYTQYMFKDCLSLESIEGINNWNTSNVTDMAGMFVNCSVLEFLDLSGWDTSDVADMDEMFLNCWSLSSVGDLSNWKTGNVEYMSRMFSNCSSLITLGDLSNWDVSNVTSMEGMFGWSSGYGADAGCANLEFIGNLSNWDTSNVANMHYMFENCIKLTKLDLTNWDVNNVTTMEIMFYNCESLTTLDISNWDTSNVTDMSDMFRDCYNLKKIKILNQQTLSKLIEYLPTRTNAGYIFTNYQVPENNKNWIAYNPKDSKVVFRLPRPLRRVQNVYDRLYWDYNKRHYCIEVNIDDDYNILEIPQIIDLKYGIKSTMIFEENTVFNTNVINTCIGLSSSIYKQKPIKLVPSKKYTLRFKVFDAETVTIDLGGRIIEVNPIENKVDIQIETLGELTNEYLSIYGENGVIVDVMLFEGTDIEEVGYIDNITSVGELQEDGSYKINLMTSPYIIKGGHK